MEGESNCIFFNKACRRILFSIPCHCFGGETLLSTVWKPQNWRKLFQEGMAETEDSLCLQMTLSVKPLKEIKHECKFRVHCDLIFAKKLLCEVV